MKLLRVLYVPDLGYNLFSPVAEFDGMTYDVIGGPDRIMTVFGGTIVFRQDNGNTLTARARRVAPTTVATALSAIGKSKKCEAMDINDFHRIYGHASEKLLRATAKRLDVRLTGELKLCAGCAMGKAIRHGVPSSTKNRATERLERVFVDLTGPRSVASVGGVHYMMIVRDDFSRFTWLFGLKSKSSSNTAFAFRKFLADVQVEFQADVQRDVKPKVKIVRSDNGNEFSGGEFEFLCNELRIKQEFTPPYTPQYNGVAERAFGVIEMAAAAARVQAGQMYRDIKLPPTEKLWAEAMKWASDALNRTATTSNPEIRSPHEMWYGKAAPAAPHPFLQPCVIRRQRRGDKLELKGETAFYLGRAANHPSDCVRVVTRDLKIVETRDVTWAVVLPPLADFTPVPPAADPSFLVLQIAEQGGDVSPTSPGGLSPPPAVCDECDGANDSAFCPSIGEGSAHNLDDNAGRASFSTPAASSTGGTPTAAKTVLRQLAAHMTGPHDHEEQRMGRTRAAERTLREAEEQQEEQSAVTGGTTPGTGFGLVAALEIELSDSAAVVEDALNSTLLSWLNEDVNNESRIQMPTCPAHEAEPEPSSYAEACKCEFSFVWKEAMRSEFRGLLEADTFSFEDDVDPSNVIDGKWVFKWKVDSDGYIARAKARLVARGFRQVEGVDYFETFAPTPTMSTIRLVTAYACQEDVDLLHFDVDQAFVRSKLDEEVWFRLPDGCAEFSGKVVRLNMSLYGLKQASRQWNKTLTARLKKINFEQSLADPCLLRLIIGNELAGVVVIYVDDIMFAGCKVIGDAVVSALNTAFPVKNLGDLKWFMGSHYQRDGANGMITVSQNRFVENMLCKFAELPETHGTSSLPACTTIDLRSVGEDDEDAVEKPFRAVVGSLMWVANQTRPDISNAVRAVARHSHNPKMKHWKAAMKILKYLRGTSNLGLTFRKSAEWLCGKIELYADANYASAETDRRSVSGAAVMLGGAAVCWFSRTQKCVTLSTSEAEYVAMTDGLKEALYVRNVLSFIDPSKTRTLVLWEDNAGAIALSRDFISSNNSKHIDVRYHFIRQKVEAKEVVVDYVESEKQHADILTKALGKVLFDFHRDFLLGN